VNDIAVPSECIQVHELANFIGEQLPSARQAALEAHVEACTACQAVMDEWSARENPLRSIPRDGLSLSPPGARKGSQPPVADLGQKKPADAAFEAVPTADWVPPPDPYATCPPEQGRLLSLPAALGEAPHQVTQVRERSGQSMVRQMAGRSQGQEGSTSVARSD
jgi:hypothetical protein